ncbi:MAG TPA: chemotaxis protein CheB [Bacteroidales bacterium]|nr:chemotaxis protein CheB [Bacteroidales bacterium]
MNIESKSSVKSQKAVPVIDNKLDKDRFHIVGIGASAGGLEALEQFFMNMPENAGFAFVVIQHLSPDHKGMLGELLQRITKMQVHTVTDRMRVTPNAIYVIPSNKSMSIVDGTLHLSKPLESHGLRLPIDLFFRSLAEERKEKSIGIVLSGMGSDGSLGLKAIKEVAGLVLVQDPVSSKFDSMPRSAIDAVLVDIIATANELPQKLITLTNQYPQPIASDEPEKNTSELDKIIFLLHAQTGNDFSQYKKTTLYRRIERRMGIHQVNEMGSYVRYLQENPAEIDILFKELLIGVTNFFRDADVWEQLKENVLPSVFARLPQRYTFRVWVPGCSTGEEAYSLSIVFVEALEKANLNKSISLQIFATDLDYNAIDKARKGIYMANIVSDVTPERLSRFFTQTGDQYKVNTIIREMVVFAPQNVIKDPPFTRLDMVSCRNLLIYIDAELQKKILSLFHYSLNPGGILLLGCAETNGSHNNLFTSIHTKSRLYQRSGMPKHEEFLKLPNSFSYTKPITENSVPVKTIENIQTLTDQLLLQQFSPASVLVTDKGDILYLTGNTGKYLSPAAGRANMNLFAMAREGLRKVLPMAFHQARQSFEKVHLNNINVGGHGETQLTDVIIQKIEEPAALKNKILVCFYNVPEEKSKHRSRNARKPINDSLEAELAFEIQRLKEELESTHEEMQTSQEELRSTNEELQSTNEELQSANEELTTSKEEMQSLNEELQTMNVELQSKIDDSVSLNNDMNNLLNSIEIATLFLDRNLNIRQFTTPATKIFKIRKQDIGRPFTDQVTDLDYPDMYNDALEVLHTLVFIEKPVATRDGRWFSVRIMPYRTSEDKIDGLVITFINITKSKQQENTLEEMQTMFHTFVGSLPIGVIYMLTNGEIIDLNVKAEELLGHKSNNVIGKNFFSLFMNGLLSETVKNETHKLSNGMLPGPYQNRVQGMDGSEFIIEWSAYKLKEQKVLIGLLNQSKYATP